MKGETIIHSNGSKMAGEKPDTIDQLLEVLKRHPLNRSFGRFITRRGYGGMVRFFGNFLTAAHVFCIDSNESAVIDRLTRAIHGNQHRLDYRAQPKSYRSSKRRAKR
jgi:hypothetical protein